MVVRKITSFTRLPQVLFPKIPRIKPGMFLLPPGDEKYGLTPREMAAGIVVTICAREGRWIQVPLQEVFNEVARFTFFTCKARETREALEMFETEGLLEFVEFQGCKLIVPTPELAKMVIDPLAKGYFI